LVDLAHGGDVGGVELSTGVERHAGVADGAIFLLLFVGFDWVSEAGVNTGGDTDDEENGTPSFVFFLV